MKSMSPEMRRHATTGKITQPDIMAILIAAGLLYIIDLIRGFAEFSATIDIH